MPSGGFPPDRAVAAVKDAAAAIEECVGRAFRVLRELRGAFAEPVDTESLAEKISVLHASAETLARSLRHYSGHADGRAEFHAGLVALAESLERLGQDEDLQSELIGVLKPLTQKSSATLSRLAGTTQLRDEAEQRLAHVRQGLECLPMTQRASRQILLRILSAQTNGVAKSITDLRRTIESACTSLSALVGVQRAALKVLPKEYGCSFATLEADMTKREAMPTWTTMQHLNATLPEKEQGPSLENCRAELDVAALKVAECLFELERPISERLRGALDRIEDLVRVTEGLDPIASELDWIAEQIMPDGGNDGLSADTHHSEDAAINEIWASYTMEAEREIHRNTLRKLKG